MDSVSSAPLFSKLATEHYDWDDGRNRTPPMRQRIVTLKPSPSPEYLPQVNKQPSPEPVYRSSTNRRPKRRARTKASQGDAVLVGYMANQNNPEVAARAGEEALNSQSEASQSEADDPSPSVTPGNGGASGETSNNALVQTAQHALPLLNGPEELREDHPGVTTGDPTRLALPSLSTKDLLSPSRDVATVGGAEAKSGIDGAVDRLSPNPNAFDQAPIAADNIQGIATRLTSPASSRPSQGRRRHSSETSPLRRYAIPASEASPMETLPAMQNSPPSMSANSPKGQQTLPPLYAHLSKLVEGHPLNDNARRTKGLSPGRSPYQSVNGSVRSPSLGPIQPRSGQYPSPQARTNGHFSSRYSPVQSWSPSYSDPSPREPYPHNPDALTSPPRSHEPSRYYPNGRIAPGKERTTVSAESYPIAGSYGTEISPTSDHINLEVNRPILQPPPGNLPAVTGLFRCEHSDCKAQPFQTQYLLNSHMNVHSQNRPHYCPVATCERSEGGKGFKRKNEMIRHGLVHRSPGYICPFCPEREHKYPRPDNLQRHVRVNHIDVDLNDIRLREVLAQRLEPGTRGRRRRLGG